MEEDGQLLEASTLYVESAITKVNETDFEPGNEMWHAISELNQAISCTVRGGNLSRAKGIRNILEGLVEHSIMIYNLDDICLEGILHEWIGDASLMSESGNPKAEYRAAADLYRGVSVSDQRFWGWQEEFEYSQWAFEDYLKHSGFENDENSLPSTLFTKRIEEKYEIVESDSADD